MLLFILRRLLSAIPTLFLIVTIAFFLIRVAPGGPFDLEQPLEAKVMENLRRIYRLDLPLAEQYWLYLAALMRGDFGPSFYFRDFTIAELFARGLPVSVTLGALALTLAVAIGGALGTIAAFRQNSAVDHAVVGLGAVGLTIPNFVVAPVLQILFGLTLAWLPVGGWGSPSNLVLPVVTLALPQVAVIARMTRAAMIETLRANHIRTLRSLGLPTSVIVRHALRGAALPVVSYLGPGRRRAPHRLGRGRDHLRPAGRRALLRRGSAEPRLHPRHGDRRARRRLRPRLQSPRRRGLRAHRSAGAL